MTSPSLDPGTVLITGPTGGLGRALTLSLASRPQAARPDLLLVGRPGDRLTAITDAARAAGPADAAAATGPATGPAATTGTTAHAVPCDFASLADVRSAAATAKDLLTSGALRPLRALIANVGVTMADTRKASADGYEMTFAVNYLAHAQLIGDLLDMFVTPARIVLLGSNVYRGTAGLRMMGVPGPAWRDPLDLAKPATGPKNPGFRAAGVAYATSKLAILYYAHELQRRIGQDIAVSVFEPGFMPGTGLGRDHAPLLRALARAAQHLPGTASPTRSAPALASVALDDRWATLRDGAFVLIDKETEVLPHAHNRDRELRLWEATRELLERATPTG